MIQVWLDPQKQWEWEALVTEAVDQACANHRPESREHEVVVEVYDGIALSMKCVPCRTRIPIRPERSATRLVDLIADAHEHPVPDTHGGQS